jgi:hypothetical protein
MSLATALDHRNRNVFLHYLARQRQFDLASDIIAKLNGSLAAMQVPLEDMVR